MVKAHDEDGITTGVAGTRWAVLSELGKKDLLEKREDKGRRMCGAVGLHATHVTCRRRQTPNAGSAVAGNGHEIRDGLQETDTEPADAREIGRLKVSFSLAIYTT